MSDDTTEPEAAAPTESDFAPVPPAVGELLADLERASDEANAAPVIRWDIISWEATANSLRLELYPNPDDLAVYPLASHLRIDMKLSALRDRNGTALPWQWAIWTKTGTKVQPGSSPTMSGIALDNLVADHRVLKHVAGEYGIRPHRPLVQLVAGTEDDPTPWLRCPCCGSGRIYECSPVEREYRLTAELEPAGTPDARWGIVGRESDISDETGDSYFQCYGCFAVLDLTDEMRARLSYA